MKVVTSFFIHYSEICDEEVEQAIQEIVEEGKLLATDAAEPVEDNLISVPLSPLQATTAVAETTVVADIRGLTVFSAIDVVPCTSI